MNGIIQWWASITAIIFITGTACLAAAGEGTAISLDKGGPASVSLQSGAERDSLKREALAASEKGESEMRAFAHANTESITPEIIEDIAEQGKKEKKENLIILARIMAAEKHDSKSIAETLVRHGDYYQQLSRTSEAMAIYGKALRMFETLGDITSQGQVYAIMGNAVLLNKDKREAAGYYDKALPLLVKGDAWKDIGYVSFSQGLIRSDAGDIAGAKELYEKALSMFEKAGELDGQRYVCKLLGQIYFNNKNLADAQKMFERALPLFIKEGNAREVGYVSLYLGEIHKWEQRTSKAKEMLELSLANYTKAEDPVGLGLAHMTLGGLHFQNGNRIGAEDEYGKALAFFTRANLPNAEAKVCRELADLQLDLHHNYAAAQELYEKALRFSLAANDPLGQGEAYRGLGNLQFSSGNFMKALEMYDKALPLLVKAGARVEVGMLYMVMATAYQMFGNNAKAMECYEKGLAQLSFTGKPTSDNPINIAGAYKQLADISLHTGNSARTMELFEKALSLYATANDRKGQGDIYQALGDIQAQKGDAQKARELYDKALSCFTESGYLIGEGGIHRRFGEMQVKAGNDVGALEQYAMALQIYSGKDVINDWQVPYALQDVYVAMGDIYLRAGNFAKTVEICDKGIENSSRVTNQDMVNGVLTFMKAKALARSGRKEEAAGLIENAMKPMEKTRRQAGLEEFRKNWTAKMQDGYQNVTLFMLSNGYKEKAFRYAESMKARLFLDQLAEGRVDLEKGIAPELKKQRDDLERELTRINTGLQAELNRKEPDKKRTDEIREEYRKKEAELEELKNTIRLKNPLYAQVEYPQPVSVTDLQHNTLGPNEILLEYFIAESAVYRFMISRDRYDVIKLPITIDELDKGIASLKAFVSDPDNASRMVLPLAVDKTARRLYDALIAPGMESFAGKTLIIVPDGAMATLPFEILKSGDRYAVEKHKLVYVQSASVLAALRAHQTKNSTAGFIGFGDPVYDYENFKTGKPEKGTIEQKQISYADMVRGSYLERGGVLNRLQGSGEEVKAIAALFTGKGEQAASNLRLDAREEKARSTDMERYGYIHFATHGILNDRLQAIALSQIPDSDNDGFLTVGKLMNSRFNARLVVLSACRTGEGKLERGEGVTGLTRAVMYAGTPAAVVSLWSVSDDGTKELMIKMYQAMLRKGKAPGEALREAKLAMIRERTYSAPYYWGAFVMYGE